METRVKYALFLMLEFEAEESVVIPDSGLVFFGGSVVIVDFGLEF